MESPYYFLNLYYALLTIAFVAVISYMVVYNLRSKAREKLLARPRTPIPSTDAAILDSRREIRSKRPGLN